MRRIALVLTLVLPACARNLQVRDYPSPMALYDAGLKEYNERNWKNAVTALDQVVVLLGPRDSLLSRAHYYLARSHFERGHFLLASKSFEDLFRAFPEDSLADDAMLGMANSEARLWRRPDLDPTHGQKAGETYLNLQRLYPDSPLVKDAQDGERRMAELFAQKDYDVGMGLLRRRADHSALIYFRAALSGFQGTRAARDAGIQMVGIFRRLQYTEDMLETCRLLRVAYADDNGVKQACTGVAADTTS